MRLEYIVIAAMLAGCTATQGDSDSAVEPVDTDSDTRAACLPGAYGAVLDHVVVYDERAAFVSALSDHCLQRIDFDDIDASGSEPVPFSADRYLGSHGVRITGTDGQYVHTDWGYGAGMSAHSAPNSYAPGPPATGSDPGGFHTQVSFERAGASAQVAAVAIVFIDADYPTLGPSSLAVFDASDTELGTTGTVSGGDGSQVFRGLIAVDGAGLPVAAIASAQLINGNEWPPRDVDEGVSLDDLITDPPQ